MISITHFLQPHQEITKETNDARDKKNGVVLSKGCSYIYTLVDLIGGDMKRNNRISREQLRAAEHAQGRCNVPSKTEFSKKKSKTPGRDVKWSHVSSCNRRARVIVIGWFYSILKKKKG